MPFFSVITTTFNRAQLLQRAITSLLAQDEQDWEAVIVDDGSRDDTLKLIHPIIQGNNKFHLLALPHSGSEYARNAGIEKASGSYITFLDSDDEYLPEHLSARKEILAAHPKLDLLHGGVKVIGDAFVPDRNDPEKQIAIADCVVGGTFVIKRELVRRLNGFKEIPYGSDADFFDRATASGAKVLKTDLATYIYHREHTESITGSYS